MKAVIYARYSSDNQREESIEGQIRECTAFAEKNGITILRHYIDRAFSAKTDNRPEFQNMIKDSSQGLFEMVLVWKLDRFSRNRYDSAHYKAILKKNNVKVVSATEKISEGSEGILMESILEGFAEYYSADLSEKIVRGMTENALKHKYNGGGKTIGYVIDKDQCFQIDPLTAPLVLEAYKRYDKGTTMKEIRDWMNEQGFRNSRGNPIAYSGVEHILSNRRYIGEYRYRDIVVPGGIPQIVPQDLFDRVQTRLEKNKRAPARFKAEDEYILSGKLFCGYCGEVMVGESGTGRNGVHHYYKCSSIKRKLKTCSKKTVKKAWLEDKIIQRIKMFLEESNTVEAVIAMVMDMQERESLSIPAFEQQLKETNTAIDNLLNAIQQGILTKSTKERLEWLEAQRDELEQKIAAEKLAKPKISEEFIRYWFKRFQHLDTSNLDQRKMLINTFVNSIYLFDDKALVNFNYKDGTETINFSEVECALKQRASLTGSDLEILSPPNRYLKKYRFFFALTQNPLCFALKSDRI